MNINLHSALNARPYHLTNALLKIVFGLSLLTYFPKLSAQNPSDAESTKKGENTATSDDKPNDTTATPPVVNESKPPETKPAQDATPAEEKPAESSGAEDPNSYHSKTPPSVGNKLWLALGLGIGASNRGRTNDTYSDKLSFHLSGYYALQKLIAERPLLIEARYQSITAVITKKDESKVIQYFLVGPGVDALLNANKNISLVSSFLFGLTKSNANKLNQRNIEKSVYGVSFGIQSRVFRPVAQKIDLFSGLGLQMGSLARFDIQFGVRGGF